LTERVINSVTIPGITSRRIEIMGCEQEPQLRESANRAKEDLDDARAEVEDADSSTGLAGLGFVGSGVVGVGCLLFETGIGAVLCVGGSVLGMVTSAGAGKISMRQSTRARRAVDRAQEASDEAEGALRDCEHDDESPSDDTLGAIDGALGDADDALAEADEADDEADDAADEADEVLADAEDDMEDEGEEEEDAEALEFG
jgi:hypothetical protein